MGKNPHKIDKEKTAAMSKDKSAPQADGSEPELIEIVGLDEESTSPETGAPEAPAETAPEPAGNLEDLRRENAEIQERLLRKHADVENMRKRMEREKAEFRRYAAADLVRKLLPVLDNLERAAAAQPDASGEIIREGIRLVNQELRGILEREGLEPVEAAGKPFDPTLHEAVLREESTEVDSEQVVEELQKGFLFRDRLLRPALVKVAVPASPGEDPGEPDDRPAADSNQD